MTLQNEGKAWNTDRSRMAGGVVGSTPRRRLSFSRNVHETVLQAGIFAVVAYIDDFLERNYTTEQIYLLRWPGSLTRPCISTSKSKLVWSTIY
jgi:hypothetical protein